MIRGECFCGTVSYEIEGSLIRARSCHCSQCRRIFGGAASAFAEIAESSQFRWVSGEDKLHQYTSEKDWGLGFCSNCGSALCGLFQGAVIGVTLGCVSGDPGVEIEQHIYVGSKASWDHIGGPAPQFETRSDDD